MLKCIIFVSAIYMFGTLSYYSTVQCSIFNFKKEDKYELGKTAEDLFVKEIAGRLQHIAKLEKNVAEAKANLSFWTTAKKIAPGTGVVSFVKKWTQVLWDMINISRRDFGQLQLKIAKHQYKQEKLLTIWKSGTTTCEEAFENDYFKTYRKWILLKKHSYTKKKKKIWIKVQSLYQNERQKLWRTSKRCMAISQKVAEGEPNRPFPVYISASVDYEGSPAHKIYVFTTTPWELQDEYQWIFFWQHVVSIEAYLY